MAKVWSSIFLLSGLFIGYISAGVEIISSPSKVVVIKPKPMDTKNWKINLNSKLEKQNNEYSTDSKLINNVKNSIDESNNSSDHPEVKSWPKVFVLSHDLSYPVVCYAGISLNISKIANDDNGVSSREEDKGNNTNRRNTEIFMLSADPVFPVLCRKGPIPPDLTVSEDKGDEPFNVTCILRDYEQNISAIFLQKAGPIDTAWNVFDRSTTYTFNDIKVKFSDNLKILNETIVDCDKYGFTIDDKGISAGAAASLAG